jgi:hypothetical protein
MLDTRPLLCVGLGLALGCVPCNSVGCDQGFLLELVRVGGLEGSVQLSLDLEGEAYQVTCATDGISGPCDIVAPAQGSMEIEAQVYEGDMGTMLSVRIWDGGESHDDFIAYRGPESVGVIVEVDGVLVAEASYSPVYDRSEHRGDASCGYCDVRDQTELLEIAQ